MTERLELKVGDTFPSLRFQRRAASGQTWPEIDGASSVMFSRVVGTTTPMTEHAGGIALSLENNVITGEYVPVAADSATVGEYDAEVKVSFSDGRVATFPGNINGIARYFRLSVVAGLGEIEPIPTAGSDDGSGLLGIWIGLSP
jgi:hypothetical protein